MWELRNKTPFEAVQAFDRDEAGREVLCIALRGTFCQGADGLCQLVTDPEPVLLAPLYQGPALAYDADILPFLPGAELTVHGLADPVLDTPRLASVSLGALTKTVALHPRLSRRDGRLVSVPDPAPVSLDWTQCPGGPLGDDAAERHPENPIGCGLHPAQDGPLPRITIPQERPETARTVTGLGPVQRHWQPRLHAAGSYDDHWTATRAPLLPDDFNRIYHHAAPRDQCFSAPLLGGEPLRMQGFARAGDLDLRLPQVVIDIRAEIGNATETAAARLYRVRLHPDRGRFDLLWLGAVPCGGRDHLLRRTTVHLRQWAGISR